MRLYRGFDPSAVYIRQGGQYYSVDPESIPMTEVQGIPSGAVPITDAEMGRVISRTLLDACVRRQMSKVSGVGQ